MAELILALDTDSSKQAEAWVSQLMPLVRCFKVGSQLFTACGPEIVQWIQRQGCRVFLDLKFHDIPQTMAHAASAATRLGVFMFDVHAASGQAAMEEAQEAARDEAERCRRPKPLIIAVTALTSLDQRDLKTLGVSRSMPAHVLALAKLARAAGLDGVVASPQEIQLLRRSFGDSLLIVTPGIRFAGSSRNDQKRVAAPQRAQGADYVIVGRAITHAQDPRRAVEQMLRQLP